MHDNDYEVSDEAVLDNMRQQIMETTDVVLRHRMISSFRDDVERADWMTQTRFAMICDLIAADIEKTISDFDTAYAAIKELRGNKPTSQHMDFDNAIWLAKISMLRGHICALPDGAESILAYLQSNFEYQDIIEILCANPDAVMKYSEDTRNEIMSHLKVKIDQAEPFFKIRTLAVMAYLDPKVGNDKAVELMADPDKQVSFNACVLLNTAMGYEPFDQELYIQRMEEGQADGHNDDDFMLG